MKHNKRGIFMGSYFVVLTLLMMGIVISLYFANQKTVHGSLASPYPVLRVAHSVELFEAVEKTVAEEVLLQLQERGVSSSDERFQEKFRELFFERISGSVTSLLLTDAVYSGSVLVDYTHPSFDLYSFLSTRLYPEEFMRHTSISFTLARAPLTKKILLNAPYAKDSLGFPVEFSYSFEKTYTFHQVAGGERAWTTEV